MTGTPQPTGESELAGRGRIARRWANWAANLLVSGVLIVVGIVFGREVLQWWHAESPLASGPASVGPASKRMHGSSELPSGGGSSGEYRGEEIVFGELPIVFRRGSFVGDLNAALETLRRECQQAAGDNRVRSRAVGTAERRLLEELRSARPVAREDGVWELFLRERPIPMAVVVTAPPRNEVAQDRQVLAWGVLFPEFEQPEEELGERDLREALDERWTWFVWRPSLGDQAGGGGGDSRPAIPASAFPGGRRVMAVREADGTVRQVYVGPGTLDAWRAASDACFVQAGAEQGGGQDSWTKLGDRFFRRYRRETLSPRGSTQPASSTEPTPAEPFFGVIDVILHEEESGELRAVVIMSPRASAQ